MNTYYYIYTYIASQVLYMPQIQQYYYTYIVIYRQSQVLYTPPNPTPWTHTTTHMYFASQVLIYRKYIIYLSDEMTNDRTTKQRDDEWHDNDERKRGGVYKRADKLLVARMKNSCSAEEWMQMKNWLCAKCWCCLEWCVWLGLREQIFLIIILPH